MSNSIIKSITPNANNNSIPTTEFSNSKERTIKKNCSLSPEVDSNDNGRPFLPGIGNLGRMQESRNV